MITEGLVALIWATVAMYFFYNEPTPGYQEMAGGEEIISKAPAIVSMVCDNWLGLFGSILAILGVVAAPITSGDTALRSARLIIADFIHLEQKTVRKRLYVCIPMFAAVIALLIWQMANPEGFDVIWSWFGWSNQTLSVFTLWAITVYLYQQKKNYWISLVPAVFMTVVSVVYLLTEQIF
jgi:carbon starvation protein CstA